MPQRVSGSGRITGGRKFTRGQIYKILSNPVYAGKIVHHGKVYAGRHSPIVSDALWETVRQRLESNRQGYHSGAKGSGAALLSGLLWTSDGGRFKSNHACKGKKRYRYYVADPLPNRVGPSSMALRVPSREMDSAVIQVICEALGDPLGLLLDAGTVITPAEVENIRTRADALIAAVHSADPFTVRFLVRRVTFSPSSLEVEIDTKGLLESLGITGEASQTTCVLRSVARLARTGRAIRLVQHNGRSASQPRPNLAMVQHLLKAREWWEQLKGGNVRVADIARHSGVSDSWVSRMVRLNFLAPSVVESIVAGSTSAQIGPILLQHPALPLLWVEQENLLGISQKNQ